MLARRLVAQGARAMARLSRDNRSEVLDAGRVSHGVEAVTVGRVEQVAEGGHGVPPLATASRVSAWHGSVSLHQQARFCPASSARAASTSSGWATGCSR